LARTSTAGEAVGEDPTALGEAVVSEVTTVQAWRRAVGEAINGWGGVEVDATREAWRRTRSAIREEWRRTRRGDDSADVEAHDRGVDTRVVGK
jgi:hypothetical protein